MSYRRDSLWRFWISKRWSLITSMNGLILLFPTITSMNDLIVLRCELLAIWTVHNGNILSNVRSYWWIRVTSLLLIWILLTINSTIIVLIILLNLYKWVWIISFSAFTLTFIFAQIFFFSILFFYFFLHLLSFYHHRSINKTTIKPNF